MSGKVWQVVIIDDSPDDRAEVRRLLLNGSDRRYKFTEAETGAGGIQACLGGMGPPACVVLDYHLDEGNGLSVKCQDTDTSALLIDMGRAVRAPYFHASWVRIPFGLVPDDELADRIRISYGVIRATLTRKLQASLAPWPPS